MTLLTQRDVNELARYYLAIGAAFGFVAGLLLAFVVAAVRR